MIAFISPLTGSEMMVHESRVDEYLALGYKVADQKTAEILAGVSKSDTPAKPKPKPKKAAKPKE